MAKRVCSEAGCPELIDGPGRCPEHERVRDKARGTRQQRGYTSEHDQARAKWKPHVEAGGVPCRRCRKAIRPGTPWDLGHPDADCDRPRAPEHEACNRATAGRP